MEPKFPHGKLNENDEGEATFRLFLQDRTLIVDFGRPVTWFGLRLDDVVRFRELLEKYERQLRAADEIKPD
jgi:hypothetical protein